MMPHDAQEHSGEGDSECADLLESELNVSLKPLVVKAGQNGNVFTAKRRQEAGDSWATVKQVCRSKFGSRLLATAAAAAGAEGKVGVGGRG